MLSHERYLGVLLIFDVSSLGRGTSIPRNRTFALHISYLQPIANAFLRLGLRSVAAKVLLLLCDLYFIVFSASNLSLAFSALFDGSWACFETGQMLIGQQYIDIPKTCPNNPNICYKQKALSGVLLVTLLAWLLCFSISVLRVVEKLRLEY